MYFWTFHKSILTIRKASARFTSDFKQFARAAELLEMAAEHLEIDFLHLEGVAEHFDGTAELFAVF